MIISDIYDPGVYLLFEDKTREDLLSIYNLCRLFEVFSFFLSEKQVKVDIFEKYFYTCRFLFANK